MVIGASSDIKIVNVAVERGAGHDEALDLAGSLVDLGDLSPVSADLAVYQENSR